MAKKKKKIPQEGDTKTMKEVSKGFEEFMQNKRTRAITRKEESETAKEDFDKLVEKSSKPRQKK